MFRRLYRNFEMVAYGFAAAMALALAAITAIVSR